MKSCAVPFTLLCWFSLQTLVNASAIPTYNLFKRDAVTRAHLKSRQAQSELGALVSKSTAIYGPDDPRYENVTERWNTFAVPRIQLVVEPGVEGDVSVVVRYCNENSIDFLAINRGHGYPVSLGSFKGIQINMASLTAIAIDSDASTAWFGGGAYDGQVTEYLWEQGYVTTTGSCDCVGMLGPGLGGGHGRHEGIYGLISDNILQFNIVLANGTSIRVNDTSHADLLWGLKGAGHNFGIVTSFEMNVFPRGPDTWAWNNYVWRGEYLTGVFEALNELHGNGSTPPNMAVNVGSFLMDSSIATDKPVISWTFAYRGPQDEASSLLAALNAIPSVSHEFGDLPYPAIPTVQDNSFTSDTCTSSRQRITSTAGLQVYNVTAESAIFASFQSRLAAYPVLASNTSIVHEGYLTAAAEAGDRDGSAYPFRDDHHLMLFNAVVADGPDMEDREAAAWEWAREVRDLWNAGQPGRKPHAYVNYANGFESVEEIYGGSWRVERLRTLKEKYDPWNRFRYYNPIVRD